MKAFIKQYIKEILQGWDTGSAALLAGIKLQMHIETINYYIDLLNRHSIKKSIQLSKEGVQND